MSWLRVVLTALVVVANLSSRAAADSPRPNLVAIVTDDQARWAMGAYGNKDIKTPHMDRLARDGAILHNAFVVTPVCSPSRVSYLTGRWGTEVGITDYISPEQDANGLGLSTDFTTWPRILQQAGYRTALVGKWHLGALPKFHPSKHGFDHFVGFLGGGIKPRDFPMEKDGKTSVHKGFIVDLVTDEAIAFIQDNKDRPFALLLHYREPHAPYTPVPEEDAAALKNLDPAIPDVKGIDVQQIKQLTREYYSSLHAVDRNLGRLLAKLDELKLADHTVVSFTSDHGYMIGHHACLHKGNAAWIAGGINGPRRPNMFDDSIRIPWLFRCPSVIKPGTVIHHHLTHLDALPTFLGILDVPIPEKLQHHGTDFSPLLRGKDLPDRDAVFGQYDLHNFGAASMRMIRTPEWKFVRHFEGDYLDELYDLKNDPNEANNLARNANHAKTRNALQARLLEWQQSIDDPILKKK